MTLGGGCSPTPGPRGGPPVGARAQETGSGAPAGRTLSKEGWIERLVFQVPLGFQAGSRGRRGVLAQAPRPSLETALSPSVCRLCSESGQTWHPDNRYRMCRGEGIPCPRGHGPQLLRAPLPSGGAFPAICRGGTDRPRGFPGAQLVKNPPAALETWVQCLGPEDPLEEGKATHFRVLAWRIPGTEELAGSIHGVAESQTRLSD